MKWSQLKKRIESTFAEKVKGRVEVFTTTYRPVAYPDRVWITFDKTAVFDVASNQVSIASHKMADELFDELDFYTKELPDPCRCTVYYKLVRESEESLRADGFMDPYYLRKAMFDYLNTSVDDALASDNPMIKGLCMLDRRFGRRRLMEFVPENESPLVQTLYQVRCEVEGLRREFNREVQQNLDSM